MKRMDSISCDISVSPDISGGTPVLRLYSDAEAFRQEVLNVRCVLEQLHSEESNGLGNIIADLRITSDHSAETEMFHGIPFSCNLNTDIFVFALSALITAAAELEKICGVPVGIPDKCFICDENDVRILFFSRYAGDVTKFRERLIHELTKALTLHNKKLPVFMLTNIIKKLGHGCKFSKIVPDAEEFVRSYDKGIFFVSKLPEVNADPSAVEKISTLVSQGHKRIYIYSDGEDRAFESALGFGEIFGWKYADAAWGDLSEGVKDLMVQESFLLNSCPLSFEQWRSDIRQLCSRTTLLILKGFPNGDMDNRFLNGLTDAVILFVLGGRSLVSPRDLEDYHKKYIII